VTACDDVRPSIGAYVLGALAPDEAAAVSLHLESCPQCAAELAALAPLPGLLGAASGAAAATEEPLPPAFEERLLDAYARDRAVVPPRRRRRRLPRLRWLVPAGGVVAAAALALAIVLVSGGGDDPQAPRYDIAFRQTGATATAATARGFLKPLDEGTELHIWLDGLPRDPDAVYEVLCDAETWTATAGTFRTDANGKAYVVLTTALRRGEYEAIRVVRRSHRRDGSLVKRNVLAARLS
jgi:anti-sigma factor RsiW